MRAFLLIHGAVLLCLGIVMCAWWRFVWHPLTKPIDLGLGEPSKCSHPIWGVMRDDTVRCLNCGERV